ncbi:MAG: hypothetical protein J7502_12100, partial [Flavisolibacter sp.]|nr:hypothetical protein [Flavisolibacter sp.]
QVASNVGLGWSLLAGGVITRTIRGTMDSDDPTIPQPIWHTQENFIETKWQAEQSDNNTNNLFTMAMDQVADNDAEPDSYNYSFLGYSGDIYRKYNTDQTISLKLYPDKSFKIDKITPGYRIIANDGIVYLFQTTEWTGVNTTSWFLSEIKTPQGGHVQFQYADDFSWDCTNYMTTGYYGVSKSKRITRIDFDYGYVPVS